MWDVYTEIHKDGKCERWFYGRYESRERANEVALDLGVSYVERTWHCVCKSEDSASMGVKNLPKDDIVFNSLKKLTNDEVYELICKCMLLKTIDKVEYVGSVNGMYEITIPEYTDINGNTHEKETIFANV